MGFIKHRSYFLVLGVLLLQLACSRKNEKLPDVTFDLVRFERLFYESPQDSIVQLQKTFPYFFPSETPQKVWMNKQKDSLQLALYESTKAIQTQSLTDDLQMLFGRFKKMFPKSDLPKKVITVVSDVDYNNKVIDADSLLLISVDVFLGKELPLYDGIPLYIRENMRPDQMMPQVAKVLSERCVDPVGERTFLAHMIYHGKKHWLKHQLLPDYSMENILGYTPKQLSWARANEKEIWNYFTSQELLFSTQPGLLNRFIHPAPFSKFYLDIDRESPGEIGKWLGLQIVLSYAKQTNKNIQETLNTPYMELYRVSKYKPRR